jgi:phosphate-selective porin OprO/OprP
MFKPSRKGFCLPVLIVLLAAGSAVHAQDAVDTVVAEKEKQAKAKEIEATSDLRDAVHENLETIQEDAEAVEAVKSGGTFTDDDESSSEEETSLQPTEKKKIFDYTKALPGYLQSVPERVPFLRDRGLIFFGRSELDYAHYSSGITKPDSGFRVRSLRAGVAKAFKYSLSMKAEVDLTDGDSNFADLYVRYRHKRWGLLTVGNQRVAQALVNQTSRISRTFMEEPLPAEAFGLGRRLALGWDFHKSKGGSHITLFGPDLNGSIGDSGYAWRAYFNPTRSRFSVFHIGASFVREKMDRKTRFFSHPESRVTNERLVDTGIFDDISQQSIAALEIAGAKESFMFRAEFFSATWDRSTEKDPVFKGFYAQASWVLTGESFNYRQGKFVRIRPQNPRGAWEVAARISRVDLNDEGILGGEERNVTLALNWYAPANQFRVMANLIFVDTDEHAGDENPTIFQLRAQFHW